MLVLSRKVGEKLIIDDQIEVTVLETRGDTVKIGINAPRHISIYREEIYEEIKKANEQAKAPATQLDDVLNLLGKKPKS